jgi:hypothetical protein
MIVVILAMLWNAAEIITVLVNKRGIHPVANIVLDILIGLALIVEVVLGFWIVSYGINWRYTVAIVFMLLSTCVFFFLTPLSSLFSSRG